MTTATSGMTIEVLRTIFATHGQPTVLVTDNGPQFTSAELWRTMVFDTKGRLHITLHQWPRRTSCTII